jgi:hypothetical protein
MFKQFQQISTVSATRKSGIVEIVMNKLGLTILTIKILEFWGWSWSKLAKPF